MNRAELIRAVKELGEDYRNGSELLAMMDYYHVTNLISLSDEQVIEYYRKRLAENEKR